METSTGMNSRRVITIAAVFAIVCILIFIAVYLQPRTDTQQALRQQIFSTTTVEEKQKTLDAVSASDMSGRDVPESEKIKVLESLQTQ